MKREILDRADKICKTRLKGKNTVRALGEFTLSLINYYKGVLPIGKSDYQTIYDEVRKLLINNRVHLQPGCNERLYLPRNEIDRGLCIIVYQSKSMQLELLKNLEASKEGSPRGAAIVKTLQVGKASSAIIDIFLKKNTLYKEQ